MEFVVGVMVFVVGVMVLVEEMMVFVEEEMALVGMVVKVLLPGGMGPLEHSAVVLAAGEEAC